MLSTPSPTPSSARAANRARPPARSRCWRSRASPARRMVRVDRLAAAADRHRLRHHRRRRLDRRHRLCADPRLGAAHHRADRRPVRQIPRRRRSPAALSAGHGGAVRPRRLAADSSSPPRARLRPRRRLDHPARHGLHRRRRALRAAPAGARPLPRRRRSSGSCSARPPAACSATTSAGATCSSCWRRCSRSRPSALIYELGDQSADARVARRAGSGRAASIADYTAVLRNPWARIMLIAVVPRRRALFRACSPTSAPTCICASG